MNHKPNTPFKKVTGVDWLKGKVLEAKWSQAAHRWADALLKSFPEEKPWVRALGKERRDTYFLDISK